MYTPILACGLSGIAFFFGLIGIVNRFGIFVMNVLAGLAWMTTLVVWIIDMILFGIARQHYRNAGEIAQYGNANWLTLGALVALLLGFFTSACSFFRYNRRKRDIVWKNAPFFFFFSFLIMSWCIFYYKEFFIHFSFLLFFFFWLNTTFYDLYFFFVECRSLVPILISPLPPMVPS